MIFRCSLSVYPSLCILEVSQIADGAIVGSAIIRMIEEGGGAAMV